MTRLGQLLGKTAAAMVALLLVASWAAAQGSGPASRHPAQAQAARPAHRLIIQVNSNDAMTMNLAINNATNVEQHYRALGEKVEIEVVAFGPGLHMLRGDTSPVKERIKAVAAKMPSISFKACGNTKDAMNKMESKEIPLVTEAAVVASGVVRIMELQEQGWSYLRP